MLQSFTALPVPIRGTHRLYVSQTLDMFGALCRDRNYPMLRLDGSTSITKRQKLVKQFCDPAQNQFVFLLSSKVRLLQPLPLVA